MYGIGLPLLLLLAAFMLTGQSYAENVDYSDRMQNLSEENPDEPENYGEENTQIVKDGDYVHVSWTVSKLLDDGSWEEVLFYKRSTDGGQTFLPYQIIASFSSGLVGKQTLAASGDYVHLLVAISGNVLYYRSTDAGETWEEPQTIRSAPENPDGFGLDVIMLHAQQERVVIAWETSKRIMLGDYGSGVYLHVSEDNGDTWKATKVVSSDESDRFELTDFLISGERIYVMYYDYYYADSTINMAVFDRDLTLVANTEITNDCKTYYRPHTYIPKIAASGDNVYTVWNREDVEGTDDHILVRRSTDGGLTFEDEVDLTTDILPGNDKEVIVAGGDYVYVAFVAYDEVFVHRSSDAGATFGPAQKVIPNHEPFTLSNQHDATAMAHLDPRDSTGATLLVGYPPTSSAWTYDGGATFEQLTVIDPYFSRWGPVYAYKMLVDDDGIVHMVFAQKYSDGEDEDVFYIQRRPAPPRAETNHALRIAQNPQENYYDTMLLPHGTDNDLRDALTLEAWVRPPAGDDLHQYLIHKDRQFGYALAFLSEQATAVVRTSSEAYEIESDATISTDAWVHLAMTFDSRLESDNFRLYVNGTLEAVKTVPEPLTEDEGTLMIGGHSDGANMLIDEVRLWNYARSEADIRATMFEGLSGQEEGLTSYYPMDATTRDATGRGNDGVLLYKEQFVPLTSAPQPETRVQVSGSRETLNVADRGLQMELQIPSGAFDTEVTIDYTGLMNVPHALPSEKPEVSVFSLVATDANGTVIEQFAEPITLLFSYTDERLQELGIEDPSTLRLFYWNGEAWEAQETSVDTEAKQIEVTLTHFSTYALAAGAGASDTGLSVYLPLIAR
jgi:hypothetical protein